MNTKILDKGRDRPSERMQEAIARLRRSRDSSQWEAGSVVQPA